MALLNYNLRDINEMNFHVGGRHGSDLVLLWHRPAAVALIGALAWEPPYASGVAHKRQNIK